MSLNGILSAISAHPEYKRQLASMSRFDTSSSGVPQATVRQGARPGYIGALWRQQNSPMLVITPRSDDARRLHDQLLTYLGDEEPVYFLPEPEVLPFERLAVDSYTTNQRLAAQVKSRMYGAARALRLDSKSLPHVRLTRINDRAQADYEPKPYAGRMTLFRPSKPFAGHNQFLCRAELLVLGHLQDGLNGFFARRLNEAARVHHQDVGVVRARRNLIARACQHAHHHLAVHEVLRAAQTDESYFGHKGKTALHWMQNFILTQAAEFAVATYPHAILPSERF